MSKNSNLHNAKVAKNDDFFTQLSDIENELRHYWSHGVNHFEGKSILCNCDNPDFSNFWVYFHKRFKQLGLKKLTAIHYSVTETAYVKVYNGGDDFDISVGEVTYLKGNGDFRSEECINILKGVDMVVTNPPFSLLRDFIAQLMEYNKEFAIIANMNAITYKEVFPLLKDNKMWLGVASGAKSYVLPSDSPNISKSQAYNKDGVWYQKLGNTCWFTNIDLQRRHDWMVLSKEYTPEAYPKYDNYDAINVDKVSDIPVDYFESYVTDIENKSRLTDYYIYGDIYEFLDAVKYKELPSDKIAVEHNDKLIIPVIKDNANEVNASLILKGIIGVEYRNGVMGVPITFLGKHCPEQFDIIGMESSAGYNAEIVGIPVLKDGDARPAINGKTTYARIFIRRKDGK